MLNADNPRQHIAARNHHLLNHSASKEKLRTRGVGRIDTAFPISPISGYVEDEEVSLSAREGRSPYTRPEDMMASLSLNGQRNIPSRPSNLSHAMSHESRSSSPEQVGECHVEKTDYRICYVLCLYDFDSQDPDHLSFKQNEVLEIVKQEATGWWAALRENRIGWVPSAFLQPIGDCDANSLRNLRDEHRIGSHDNFVSVSAPVPSHPALRASGSSLGSSTLGSDQFDPGWHSADDADRKAPFLQVVSPTGLLADEDSLIHHHDSLLSTDSPLSPPKIDLVYNSPATWLRKYPPSPTSPMPHPTNHPKAPPINSPVATLASPQTGSSVSPLTTRSTSPATSSSTKSHHFLSRSRSESAPSLRAFRLRHKHSRQETVPHLPVQEDPEGLDFPNDDEGIPVPRVRSGKVRQLTGDDDAQAFHNAQKAQARLPWYLQPTYGDDVIKLEYDGSVRAGTLHALIERLTVDPLKLSQETYFRSAFLTTFRTFTNADTVFDLLVERYQMDHPKQLTDAQFDEWKQKKLRPVQKRVLAIFSLWLEQHGLLEEYSHIAPRMKEFLSLIVSPDSLALTAKQTIEYIDRQMRLRRSPAPIAVTPSKKKKLKFNKNEFLKMDPADIAQHLTIYEHQLYMKVRPAECLAWAKQMKGESASNLSAFCATHDRLATWVKTSVLTNDGLAKRADTIDLWIKVAEKCRQLNNYSSMAAIVASLHSSLLERLYLTWAHVSRMSQLEPLARLTAPTANFMAHRTLYMTLEGPCVPFVGMYLTDLVHINDQLKDTITFPPTRPGMPSLPLINFIKRQKWYDAVHAILKHQSQTYVLSENPMLTHFIETQLAGSDGKDQGDLWQRAQDLQVNEVARADFRRGLEAAGF